MKIHHFSCFLLEFYNFIRIRVRRTATSQKNWALCWDHSWTEAKSYPSLGLDSTPHSCNANALLSTHISIVHTRPFFNKNRVQALSSPQTSKIKAPDSHQPVVTSVAEGHTYVAPSICDICSKPHRKIAATSTGSSMKGTYKEHEYWDDIEAFTPPKCLCFVENDCNCVHNVRRNDILPPKPVDV